MQLDTESAMPMQAMRNRHACVVSSFKSKNNNFIRIKPSAFEASWHLEMILLLRILQKEIVLELRWRSIQLNGPLGLGKRSCQASWVEFLVAVTALNC